MQRHQSPLGKEPHQRREAVDVPRHVKAVGTLIENDVVIEQVLDHRHLVILGLREMNDRRRIARDAGIDDVVRRCPSAATTSSIGMQ